MCVKCNIDNCSCDYNAEINLTRQYIVSMPGEEGPAGPAGEVPTPIFSDDLFDA